MRTALATIGAAALLLACLVGCEEQQAGPVDETGSTAGPTPHDIVETNSGNNVIYADPSTTG